MLHAAHAAYCSPSPPTLLTLLTPHPTHPSLQDLPTSGWSSADVGELLSQAFVYMSLYHNAPSHLRPSTQA